MKRYLSSIASLVLLIVLVFGTVACGGSSSAVYTPSLANPPSEHSAEKKVTGIVGVNTPAAMAMATSAAPAMRESADRDFGSSGIVDAPLGDAYSGSTEAPAERYQSSLTAGHSPKEWCTRAPR